MKKFLILILAIALFPFLIYSQSYSNTSDSASTSNKLFRIFGEIGAYGELYSMNGQTSRRPNSTGRLFFRPTLDLFGIFQIPFEFLISTEGNSARQNINQFGINPKWAWGSLHAGDFSVEYSQFTLSGIRIRGAGINLTPGFFRFSTAAGFTQRSVPGGAQDGSFKRFLFASKLGYGNQESNFLDIIFIRAKDDIGSLPQTQKSITVLSPNGNDVWAIGSLQTIRWISSGITGGVKIYISLDGGATFDLIQDNVPNIGFYNWTVVSSASFQALIKITSIEDSEIYDVSDAFFMIGSGIDSKVGPTNSEIINPNAVTPQENLVLGAKGKLSLFNNKFSFEFDGGGSVYSRDIRSSEINLDSIEVPSIVKGIFKPRISTNFDYAFSSAMNLNFSAFNTRVGYKYIGPGYNSLGAAYITTDVREISILNSLRLLGYGITAGYIRQSDNLINQKLFTTSRDIFTFGINGMITSFWASSIFTNIFNMSNDSKSDSTKIDFRGLALTTSQSFTIDPSGFFRSVNLIYSYQNTDNKSYLLKNNSTAAHTMNLGFGLGITNNLTAFLTTGFVNSITFDTIKVFSHNYSLLFQQSILSNKMLNSLNLSAAFSDQNTTFRTVLSSGYRFTEVDNISVSISYMKFNGSSFGGGNFSEVLANLSYSHQF